ESATNGGIPVRLDPGFDARKIANLGRMVEQWGLVPLAYLAEFAHASFTYGYIDTEDFSMYPLLPPGSFIQIDETKSKVVQGVWRSEYEDRKSTRLNSSHVAISYAVFCLKKKITMNALLASLINSKLHCLVSIVAVTS